MKKLLGSIIIGFIVGILSGIAIMEAGYPMSLGIALIVISAFEVSMVESESK